MIEHPSLETLLDSTLGELSDERAEAVREHLVDCEACRARMQDLLDASGGPPPGHEPVSRFEKAAARRDLARALRDEGFDTAADRLSKEPEEATRRTPGTAWSTLGLAASVGLVAFGLGSWLGTSNVEPVQVAEARASLGVMTMPDDDPVRGSTDEAPSACPGSPGTAAETFVWIVAAPGGETVGPVVDIEILTPDGTVEPRLVGGVPDEFGRLSIVRPASITPDGIYTIRWFAPDGREPLAEQRIRVACAE